MESPPSSYDLDPQSRKVLFLNNPQSFAQGVWDRLREEFPESKRQDCIVNVEGGSLVVEYRTPANRMHLRIAFQVGKEPVTSMTISAEGQQVDIGQQGISFSHGPVAECVKKIDAIIKDILKA